MEGENVREFGRVTFEEVAAGGGGQKPFFKDDNVLDMFGFPGFNSLLFCHEMATKCSLTVNGSSPDKYQKIKRLLFEYLPAGNDVRITGWDAVKFGVAESGLYDKIVLQAPSSDERHTFNNENLMKKWTSKVSRQNAKKQLLWLISALAATRPGGTVLYTTRSLSPFENDEIVEKALKKSRTNPAVAKITTDIGEATKYGVHILPDRHDFGPLYVAKLIIPES